MSKVNLERLIDTTLEEVVYQIRLLSMRVWMRKQHNVDYYAGDHLIMSLEKFQEIQFDRKNHLSFLLISLDNFVFKYFEKVQHSFPLSLNIQNEIDGLTLGEHPNGEDVKVINELVATISAVPHFFKINKIPVEFENGILTIKLEKTR